MAEEHEHSLVYVETVDPTCTEQGYDVYLCETCDEEVYDNYTEALGHEYVLANTVEPTCTEQGYDIYTCSRCNDIYYDNYTEALGHNYTGYPTFTWNGYDSCTASFTCSRCGDIITLDCTMTESQENETCTQDGLLYHIATIVYNSTTYSTYRTEIITATGHNYIKTRTVDPTCTSVGYEEYTCSNCGATYTDNYTSALGHNYYESGRTEVSCTTDEAVTYICTRCANILEEVITPAYGHNYTSVVTDPTCTERGYTTYTCSTCGYSYTGDDTSPLGHDFTLTETISPTIDTEGYDVYTCTHCGETYTTNETLLEIYTGTAIKLADADIYPLPYAFESTDVITGTYYIWDNTIVNDRVKITNSIDNCDVVGLVTGWVSIYDINKAIIGATTLNKYAIGDEIKARSLWLYKSSSNFVLRSIKNCTLYVYDDTIINGRIPVVEKSEYIDYADDSLIAGWVKVADI